MICCLQSCASDRKLRALLDCVRFLQAQKIGVSLLAANVADFDILLQLLRTSRAHSIERTSDFKRGKSSFGTEALMQARGVPIVPAD